MKSNAILIIPAVCTLILAAIFGGAEIGMYQVSRLRLRLGVERKRPLFVILSKTLSDGRSLLISILIGTNITQYATTSIITYIFIQNIQNTHVAEVLTTLVIAPVLFIFAEVVPKNIFFFRADTLMPYISPFIFACHKLFSYSGIGPLLRIISSSMGELLGATKETAAVLPPLKKRQLAVIIRETHEEGFLTPLQSEIMNRIAGISTINLGSVMVPIARVRMVDVNSDNKLLLRKLKTETFTRILVYEKYRTNIIGFINIYEALGCEKPLSNLRDFIKPLHSLPAGTLVTETINFMKSENCRMVLVTGPSRSGHDNTLGIVTMQDLVEELVGELASW